MRVLAWISLVVGVVSLFVASALLIGNDDLAVGGPSLLPYVVTDNWRLLLGLSIWVGAVGLSAAWIAFRRLPGLAWLSLLVPVILIFVYLAVGLVPSVAPAVVALLIGGIAVPVGVAAIGSAIGGAVKRRLARTATL
ncbi:hypothetical protein ITJ38_01245 [Agreia pratensis]|uniref:hypothetical protein n=1 Tax=Agreia pratensis TaxID=150121 RepID=UPI00188C3068|nr:hypothetical protein [Agreia pratensis]MBF4633023.1 hypothetical protein [Agreia pratensis]